MTERHDIEQLSLHDRHVVKRIAQSSSSDKFIAKQDIRGENGEVLIKAGHPVEKAHLNRLLTAKLLDPIDSALIHSGGVTVNSATLVGAAQKLIHNDPHTQCLFNTMRNQLLPLDILKELDLPQQLAFKLHLLLETMPGMFSHSISVALTAMYIGIQEEMSSKELGQLAAAGLFHDIGELHLDPDLVGQPEYRTPHQEYHNRVHPLLGYMLLKQFPKFQPEISEAVLQHHERLDGSGYPRGLIGDEISTFGQILSISELVCSVYEKDAPEQAFIHLEAILHLNEPQFKQAYVEHLLGAYWHNNVTSSTVSQEDVTYILGHLSKIGSIFRSWLGLIEKQAKQQSKEQHEAIGYISKHLNQMINALHSMGYDPWHAKIGGADAITDKKKISEGIAVIHETYYQLHQMTNEYTYRWQDKGKDAEPDPLFKALGNWIDTLHTSLEQQSSSIR
jgi:HD-GYP domain-containing protein (c-di-GMP phosphodiesterase class II)